MIEVTNGNSTGVWSGDGVFYIGRGDFRHNLRQSPLCNPYTSFDYPNRRELLAYYQVYLSEHIYHWQELKIELDKNETRVNSKKDLQSIKIMSELHLIAHDYKKGKCVNLVCYCKPLACHGDVIKEKVEKLIEKGIL